MANIYSILIQSGGLSKFELEFRANITSTELEEILNHLTKQKFVLKDFVRGKPKFYPIDPSVAWRAKRNELEWTAAEPIGNMEDFSKEKKVVKKTAIKDITKSIENVELLSQALFHKHDFASNHRWREFKGLDQASAALVSSLSRAKREILAISCPPRHPNVALIWESIRQKLETGVKYTRICGLDEVIEHGIRIIERDINSLGVNLFITNTEKYGYNFYIIDKSCIVTMEYQKQESESVTCRINRNKHIIERFRRRHYEILQHSQKASYALALLSRKRNEIITKAKQEGYTKLETDWLAALADWGKFSKLSTPFRNQPKDIIEIAINDGFLIKDLKQNVFLNFDIDYIDLSKK